MVLGEKSSSSVSSSMSSWRELLQELLATESIRATMMMVMLTVRKERNSRV